MRISSPFVRQELDLIGITSVAISPTYQRLNHNRDTSSDHEDEAKDLEVGAKELMIPEGPITRSKTRALQEALKTLVVTTFPMQEAMQEPTKILHVMKVAMHTFEARN